MSIQLDGNTAITNIDLSNVINSTQLIIHFWIKTTELPVGNFGYIFDANNNNGTSIRYDKSTNRLSFDVFGTNGASIGSLLAIKRFDNLTQEVAVDLIVDQTAGYFKVYFDGIEDRSATPLATPLIRHSYTDSTIGSRRGSLFFAPNGTMIDEFYYSNVIPNGFVLNGGITSKYIKHFYDISRYGERLFRKKNPITTAGIPQILLSEDYNKFGTNSGTEEDGIISGIPQKYLNPEHIK